MNRIDRLFGILLILQHKRRIRAQDLAKQFEISKRTIYRDMTALNQMGIPIAALPGQGFELVEGFYLPPLMFSENEAIALYLSSNLLTQQAAGSIAKSADQALTKITIALPDNVRKKAQELANIIRFITPPEKFNLDNPRLLTLQRAIQQKHVVHIRYHSYTKDEVTDRNVEPYRLYYLAGAWLFEGYCRLRQDVRKFRLSRIEKLIPTEETFTNRYSGKEQSVIVVKVRFDNHVSRWVRERQHYGFQQEIITPQGVIMSYQIHDLSEIIPWILSWGANAEVISPREIRQKIRNIALEMTNLLT